MVSLDNNLVRLKELTDKLPSDVITEPLFNAYVDSSTTPSIILNREGQVIHSNPALINLIKKSANIVKDNWLRAISMDKRSYECLLNSWNKALNESTVFNELIELEVHGRIISATFIAFPVFTDSDEIVGYVGRIYMNA